ncbi:MAG: hypothetical protein PGN27_03830 [Mycolicibacterium neoaurum]|uniref:hypothetical protein n=1 Tax=Mycolicibacterium neoaurum TaxID=1795 RepID=UPI002FF76C24
MEPARGSAASGRIRRWLAGWGLKEWRRAGLVAILVATAAFGGLDTVDKRITDIKVGERFDTGRFEMTVLRATLVDEVRAGERRIFGPKPGRRYLGLVTKVHNTSTLPGPVAQPVELVGLTGAVNLAAIRLADGTLSITLGPGLTDDVVLMWDVPADAVAVGAALPVRISKEVRKINATVGQGWVSSLTDYAQLSVPVGGTR